LLDIFLHVAAAAFLTGGFVFASTPWKFMAVSNALFWIGREAAQHNWKLRWDFEWIAPALTGVVIAYAVHRYLVKAG